MHRLSNFPTSFLPSEERISPLSDYQREMFHISTFSDTWTAYPFPLPMYRRDYPFQTPRWLCVNSPTDLCGVLSSSDLHHALLFPALSDSSTSRLRVDAFPFARPVARLGFPGQFWSHEHDLQPPYTEAFPPHLVGAEVSRRYFRTACHGPLFLPSF